jgi:hypothetical protein
MLPGAIDRYTGYYSQVPPQYGPRPIVAGVLHDTETLGAVECHSQGSWWLLVDRDATTYDDVPAQHCAWHVRAADRWRPSWVRPSPMPLSDVNWCTLGIEVVSHAQYRAAGEPFTEAQYAKLRYSILPYAKEQYGVAIWAGHGELQADRSDPVSFDWARAGLSDLDRNLGGHLFQPEPILPDPQTKGAIIAMLTDEEIGRVMGEIWARDGIPFEPTFAIPRQVIAAYREGHYLGKPISGESTVAGLTYQELQFGLVLYRQSDGACSWRG